MGSVTGALILYNYLKTNNIMKQTAVEWLEERYKNNINLMNYDFDQAKEMEKQQQDELAIAFAEWCLKIRFEPIENVSVKKLLEIYKKDNL